MCGGWCLLVCCLPIGRLAPHNATSESTDHRVTAGVVTRYRTHGCPLEATLALAVLALPASTMAQTKKMANLDFMG